MFSFPARPLVYVASPYRVPDPVENTHKAIAFADRMHRTEKVACVVPHLSLFWHVVRPHTADYWLDYDLALLARCDAVFRLPGFSDGADNEVVFAQDRGIPVFHTETDLLAWAVRR